MTISERRGRQPNVLGGASMFLRAILLTACLAACLPLTAAAEFPEKQLPLAFQFRAASEKDPDKAPPPFFRVFPGGKDKYGNDASGTLSTIKLARGESKLYEAEDAKAGLIVLLRRLVLVPLADGDYLAVLEGEFNAVQTRLPKQTMEQLLEGHTTDLIFESATTKGIRPIAYKVEASTRLRAVIRDGSLVVFGGEGGASITHYGLRRSTTYESAPVSLGPDDGTKPVYIGRAVKPTLKSNGSVATLPIIN
jgi:hypothetical protein